MDHSLQFPMMVKCSPKEHPKDRRVDDPCHSRRVLECGSGFLEILLKGKEERGKDRNTMGRPKVAAVLQYETLW